MRLSTQRRGHPKDNHREINQQKYKNSPLAVKRRFNTEDHQTIYIKDLESLKQYVNELTLRGNTAKKEEDCYTNQRRESTVAE
jgi:hypothetical protein